MQVRERSASVLTELRKLNKQHVRKALIDASRPVRALPLPVAQPLGGPSTYQDVVHYSRETGTHISEPVPFGATMSSCEYDQEATVFSIDGGRCTFRNNHALTADRRVLYQPDLPFGHLPVALQKLDEPVETYENVAYLSNTWVTNYYHWLLLVVPMLRFYEDAEIEIDRIYVGQPLKSWQERSLAFVGIDTDKVLVEPCRAEVGHVAMLTRHTPSIPADQIRWLRSQFVKEEPVAAGRRLFVGRGEAITRKMIDEEVVADALEREFGFEYVLTSSLTLDEEIDLFGQADAVVAPYGAAITNTLFSPIGTKVLELTAFDHDFRLAHCYAEISAAIGHRHGSLRGERTMRRKNGAYSHIKVPIDDVLRSVEIMLKDD